MNYQQNKVLVIVNHYKRPQNLPAVLQAWKNQSINPYKLVVVDNSLPYPHQSSETYPNPLFYLANDVWRVGENHGCSIRFAPALQYYQSDYTLLVDDDYLPGSDAIEALLITAKDLNNKFSTIGQEGRNFIRTESVNTNLSCSHPVSRLDNIIGYEYVYGSPTLQFFPQEVNLTVRCQFFLSQYIRFAFSFRESLLEQGAGVLVETHDDFLLCMGIQLMTTYPSYLIPVFPKASQTLIMKNLDQSNSVHHRAYHKEERNLMLQFSLQAGWKPIPRKKV